MYICNDPICDPDCDFCWFCVHGENGEPICCSIGNSESVVGGYCDEFKCRLHEIKP